MRSCRFPAANYFLFVVMIGLVACADTESKPGGNFSTEKQLVFDKLIGTWQHENGKDFERWSKKEDGTFQYLAFSIKGSDTSWNEQASVYPRNGNWVFENTVKDQNEGKAVPFTSTLLNENTVQFTNPEHDFPTDINYTVVDNNTVHAFIVGPNDRGGKDTIPFHYTRLK